MTKPEFKRKVAEAADTSWYNSVEVTFNFHYINFTKPIKSLTTIYDFVVDQIEGWEKYQNNIPSQLIAAKNYFENLRRHIIQFIKSYISEHSRNLDNYFQNVKNQINNTNSYPLLYNSPETTFLLKVHAEHPAAFLGAFNFIIGLIQQGNFQDKNTFIGTLMAYEFSMKGKNDLVKRREAERVALNELRDQYQSNLSEAGIQLVEHLKSTNERFQEYTKAVDELKKEKEEHYNEWFNQTQERFNTFDSESTKKVEDLETTYEAKLKLEKPADYWKQRAVELKTQGRWAFGFMIGMVVIACFSLYFLLWQTPEGMLKSFFNEDKSLALRWTIVFITFISFLFMGIRAVMKVMFSSFHLSRDAEERERLTYVYLAMIKDATVDKEERQLIMQSLFSRSDTGLLKEDSSPTMPGIGSLLDKSRL